MGSVWETPLRKNFKRKFLYRYVSHAWCMRGGFVRNVYVGVVMTLMI